MNLSSQHNCSSLKSKDDVSRILQNGLKIKTKLGPVFLCLDKNASENKAAILTKKNIGKAYYRNYIKRIIRDYIRRDFTLFEKFNRVIFLYNNVNRKTNYKFLKETYNRALDSAKITGNMNG